MKDNWVIRIYGEDGTTKIHQESFTAQDEILANKMATLFVETYWPGYDWTMMPNDWKEES